MASFPSCTIGFITIDGSSRVYPNIFCLRSKLKSSISSISEFWSAILESNRTRLDSRRSEYSFDLETISLISSFFSIVCFSISTTIISPGPSLPFSIIEDSRIPLNTPTSEAINTIPSFVIQYLAGLNPFLSSIAPMVIPSVNATAAGPSHGSVSRA